MLVTITKTRLGFNKALKDPKLVAPMTSHVAALCRLKRSYPACHIYRLMRHTNGDKGVGSAPRRNCALSMC